jgi:Tfp pilus assembly protein PilO
MEKKVEPKKPRKDHSLIISIIISIIILAVGYFIYVAPADQLARELQAKDTLRLEVELGEKQNRLFSIKKVAKDFENLPDELVDKLAQALPNEPNQIDLLANLPALVEASDLILTSIDFSLPSGGVSDSATNIKELAVNLSVDGVTYTRLKNFIANLEANLRILRLDSFAYSADSTNVSFKMTAFYLK